MGRVHWGPIAHEKPMRDFRRSLYFAEDVAKGQALTVSNIRRIRPGGGLPPKDYERLLGRKARKAIKRGTPVTWELVK